MHKMIRCDSKSLDRHYDKLIFLFNLPSLSLAAALFLVNKLVMSNMAVPDELYRAFFLVLLIAAAYSFTATLLLSVRSTLQLRGNKKYTYIEIIGQQLVISRYLSTVYESRKLHDYRRISLMELADVEEVDCIKNRVIIKGKARHIEGRADWLDYEITDAGRIDFDYWWFNDNGGTVTDNTEFRDVYFYIERIAQRIIFCSEKQKAREIRREEFRRRMLEAAGKSRENRRKKSAKRVFRGYEPEMERRF